MTLLNWLFFNKRFLLLILAIPLLLFSVLGSTEIGTYQFFINFDLSSLMEAYSKSDSFFKTPNTILRLFFFTTAVIMIACIPITSLPVKKYQIKYIEPITKYLIVMFLLTILSTDQLYNIVALILLFLSIIYLLFHSSKEFSLTEKYFLASYFLLFYYPFFHAFYIETNLSEIDNYLRFLFAIPVYCLIREIRVKEEYFKFIINHASLVIGLSAIYFYISDDSVRVAGHTSTATIFGNIALLFSCLSLLSMRSFEDKLPRFYSIIATITAFYAWSLTGARSSLLILLVFFIILLIFRDLRKNFFSKLNIKLTTIFLVVIIGIFSQSTAFTRITNSYDTSYNYLFSDGESSWKYKDSIIPRLIIWNGSINIISEHPFLGVGQSNFNKYLVAQIKDKKIQPIRNDPMRLAAGLNHAHSQYLDIFAKTGIVGFITLMFFLFMNLFFFLKKYLLNKNCFYAKAGLLTTISYSTYMLNHTIISHQQSSLFLSFFLVILAALGNHHIVKAERL